MLETRVPALYDGSRLDRFLKKTYPSLKQATLERWCRKGYIKLDKKAIKQAGFRVQTGQVIVTPNMPDLMLEGKTKSKEADSLSPAEVAYVQSLVIANHKDFWVINKPTGLAVQGGTGTEKHLDRLLPGLKENQEQTPKIVHRLDKATSGLLLIAKNYQAARFLTQQFKEKRIQKVYYAVTVGKPKETSGLIDAPIYKRATPAGEKMLIDHERGLPAQTYYSVKNALGNNLYYVRLEPITGRTHQLRVHCAFIGCPILGDGKYGGQAAHPFSKRTRLMLHASRLEFQDLDGKKQVYTCSFDDYIKKTLIN